MSHSLSQEPDSIIIDVNESPELLLVRIVIILYSKSFRQCNCNFRTVHQNYCKRPTLVISKDTKMSSLARAGYKRKYSGSSRLLNQ